MRSIIVDCDTCVMKNINCADCVMSVLIGCEQTPEFTQDEQAAVTVLANAGLVPPIQMLPEAYAASS